MKPVGGCQSAMILSLLVIVHGSSTFFVITIGLMWLQNVHNYQMDDHTLHHNKKNYDVSCLSDFGATNTYIPFFFFFFNFMRELRGER